jgi:hypothetical protein
MSVENNENKVKQNKMKCCRCCGLPKKLICNTCGQKKTPDNYHTGKKICKDCRSEYNKEKYKQRQKKCLSTSEKREEQTTEEEE